MKREWNTYVDEKGEKENENERKSIKRIGLRKMKGEKEKKVK